MERDLFTHLPSEIITNIFLKLPLRAISMSKCVCKAWLHLLDSDDFVSSHLSTTAPTIAVMMADTSTLFYCTLLEFTDNELQFATLTHFGLEHFGLTSEEDPEIKGAANGLLLLSTSAAHEAHHVCNPITRQCAEVPPFPGEPVSVDSHPESVVCYGFGVSRAGGEYKVVRVYQGPVVSVDGGRRSIPEPECHVHTLGTRAWRCVGPGEALFELTDSSPCVFLNGNLHWAVKDAEGGLRIWCFDLETERFSSFSAPPVYQGRHARAELIAGLSALKGCLCLWNHSGESYETVIWVMKERWEKENVMEMDELDDGFEPRVYPIDGFSRGGYILLVGKDLELFCCYGWLGMGGEGKFFSQHYVNAIGLTPSFVSLRGLGMEGVVLLQRAF